MGAKVGFQRRIVRLQRTLRSLDRNFFEPFHPALLIQLEVVPQRVLRDVHQLSDLAMRQPMTFQPQGFHPPLDQRDRMMIPLIVQGVLNRRGKLQLHRHAHSLPDDKLTVAKPAIPPRGQYM